MKHNWLRVGAYLGGTAAVALLLSGIAAVLGALLTEDAQTAQTQVTFWALLPAGLSILWFSATSSLAAVLLTFPLSWSLSIVICFLVPRGRTGWMRAAVSCLSAVPAVVFGYMSLSYLAPGISSPWWAVVVTLMLMCLMRQTLALIGVNDRHYPAMESAEALGAYFGEAILQVVLPRAARGYLSVALRMLTRSMCEGVAILLVLSAYSPGADTLPTALMKALGVTGEAVTGRWVLLLAVLLLMLVLVCNAWISICVAGGRYEKKNAK